MEGRLRSAKPFISVMHLRCKGEEAAWLVEADYLWNCFHAQLCQHRAWWEGLPGEISQRTLTKVSPVFPAGNVSLLVAWVSSTCDDHTWRVKQKGKKFSLPSREIKKASRSDMSYEAYEIHRPVHKTGSYMCVYIYVCVCVYIYICMHTHTFSGFSYLMKTLEYIIGSQLWQHIRFIWRALKVLISVRGPKSIA